MVMQDSGLLQQGCDITGAPNINADAIRAVLAISFAAGFSDITCSLENNLGFFKCLLFPPTSQLKDLVALHS
jgi:hypothetical protein